MKVTKNKKNEIKLTEIAGDDWLFMRSRTTKMVQHSLNMQDILLATILSELFLEKHTTPYIHLLPQSIKLKKYQIIAVSTMLTHEDCGIYYQAIGRELFNLFLQGMPTDFIKNLSK